MRQRALAIAIVLLSCKGNDRRVEPESPARPASVPTGSATTLLSQLPAVGIADAIGIPTRAPPVLVLLDAAGSITVAAGPGTWSALATFDPTRGAKPIELEQLSPFLKEAELFELTPQQALEHLGKPMNLRVPDDTRVPATDSDDPPPPRDSDDAPAPALSPAEQQRRARIAASGGIGTRFVARDHGYSASGEASWGTIGTPGYPERVSAVVGEVVRDHQLAPWQPAVVLAAPHAKATALIEALENSQGLIGVAHAGAVAPLRIQFLTAREGFADPAWTEVRITASTIVIEAVPDQPVKIPWSTGALDGAALAAAFATATKHHARDLLAPVDVLVDPEIDVQRLIDVVVAVDQQGFHAIGLGTAPAADDPQTALRGRRIPSFEVDRSMTVAGWLERRNAIRVLRTPSLRDCYEAALATNPELAGAVKAKLVINAKGEVTAVSVAQADATFSTCLASALRGLSFGHGTGVSRIEVTFNVAPDAR